jgi:hypothetical protein
MCLVHFLEEMEKRAPVRKYGSKLNVILEHGHPNAGDAKRIFEETRQNTMALHGADPFGTITTETKKSCARLMVADFLAYTGYMTDVQERAGVVIELGREDRVPSKASFTKLDFDPGVLEGLSDHFGGLRSMRRKAKGEAAARDRNPRQTEANQAASPTESRSEGRSPSGYELTCFTEWGLMRRRQPLSVTNNSAALICEESAVNIPEDEFAAHVGPLTEAGFALNPAAFAPLAGWNHVLLQIVMVRHYIGRLRAYEPKLTDTDDAFEQNALFVAFLTTYGKCFVGAEARSVTLDPNVVFRADPASRPAHDRIIELRHRYAAHSAGSDLVRSSIAVKEEPDRFVIKHLITRAIPSNEFASFAAAVEVLDEYVTIRLNQILDRLHERLGKPVFLE